MTRTWREQKLHVAESRQLQEAEQELPAQGIDDVVALLVSEGYLDEMMDSFFDEYGNGEEIVDRWDFQEYADERIDTLRDDFWTFANTKEETVYDWGDRPGRRDGDDNVPTPDN